MREAGLEHAFSHGALVLPVDHIARQAVHEVYHFRLRFRRRGKRRNAHVARMPVFRRGDERECVRKRLAAAPEVREARVRRAHGHFLGLFFEGDECLCHAYPCRIMSTCAIHLLYNVLEALRQYFVVGMRGEALEERCGSALRRRERECDGNKLETLLPEAVLRRVLRETRRRERSRHVVAAAFKDQRTDLVGGLCVAFRARKKRKHKRPHIVLCRVRMRRRRDAQRAYVLEDASGRRCDGKRCSKQRIRQRMQRGSYRLIPLLCLLLHALQELHRRPAPAERRDDRPPKPIRHRSQRPDRPIDFPRAHDGS